MNIKRLFLRCSLWAVVTTLALFAIAPVAEGAVNAFAAEQYFGASNYGIEAVPYATNATYTIEYDFIIETTFNVRSSTQVPSYAVNDSNHPNACTAVAGANIVGFYDRYYPNLIPDFEPGRTTSSGYVYYPNIFSEIDDTIDTLYDLMKVNQGHEGATQYEFLDGLTKYVKNRGYKLSTTSMYMSEFDVDFDVAETMKANNEVGVIFCTKYNFVPKIAHSSTGKSTTVYQYNYDVAHAMMVYGTYRIEYCKNNKVFYMEDYLLVAGALSDETPGYVKLYDYLYIDDAYLVNISN